jgi:hypothetical protein
MSKILALMIIFNVLMIVAFIFSNIYIWGFLNTQINLNSSHQPNGNTIVPSIQINGLQVIVSHAGWTSDGIMIPMKPPALVPNYPFILFWVAMIGNILFAVFILRSKEKPKKSH